MLDSNTAPKYTNKQRDAATSEKIYGCKWTWDSIQHHTPT